MKLLYSTVVPHNWATNSALLLIICVLMCGQACVYAYMKIQQGGYQLCFILFQHVLYHFIIYILLVFLVLLCDKYKIQSVMSQ